MNPRTTGVLALVACLLGAFVYFYEIEGQDGREAVLESEKRLFPGVEASSVDSLELTTNDGEAARFERRDGAWWVVAPVEGAGDAVALDVIAGALSQLARAGSVKTAPGDLAQFGLGDGAQIVRFEAEGTGHTLRVGKATPVGGNVYVTPEDGSDVGYVESFRLNAWKRSLADLRERRILTLDAGEVERLVVSWPEQSGLFELVLVRDAERVWQIEQPIAARADQEKLSTLLSNLGYLQASGFVDARTPAVEDALRETAISFRWSTAGSKGESTIRIAGLLDGVDGARLVESEGGGLRLIAAERLDDFERRLTAYRDKELVQVERASLERIELEFATPGSADVLRVVLVQKQGVWYADGRELDPEAIAGLAANLASLRASDIVADGMGEVELASVGLAPPAVRIRLISGTGAAGDGASLTIELGRFDPERGLFARRGTDPTVFLLSASLAESLPLSLADVEAQLAKSAAEPVADSDAAVSSDLLEQ